MQRRFQAAMAVLSSRKRVQESLRYFAIHLRTEIDRTEITLFVAKNCAMPHRKLRVVRLTPIALALCEHCNGQFHSRKRLQEEAKAELVKQFDVHQCILKTHGDLVKE